MVLNDWLTDRDPDEVIYLGCEGKSDKRMKINGSGYIFIGRVKDAPVEEFGKRCVMDTYPHDSDYPGTTVIIHGIEHGKFWLWHECDPSIPAKDDLYLENDTAFENLIMAIARQTIADYKAKINIAIKTKKPKNILKLGEIIESCRETADLGFLEGTNLGDYLIRTVEDDIMIEFKYPKIKSMSYDRRAKYVEKKRKEMILERVRLNEKDAYASIKGRSVKHVDR